MKKCNKCDKSFPTQIKIDGVWKNLGSRKFCLDCSPFGRHNTSDLTKSVELVAETKVCCRCKEEKSIEMFFSREDRRQKHYSMCRECSNEDTKRRQREKKKICVDYKGGKCMLCGYDKSVNALQFHHLLPSEKDFSISQKKLESFDILKPELDKCILVCANCHCEIHSGEHADKIEEYKNIAS